MVGEKVVRTSVCMACDLTKHSLCQEKENGNEPVDLLCNDRNE